MRSTRRLACCALTPPRPVALCLSLLSVDGWSRLNSADSALARMVRADDRRWWRQLAVESWSLEGGCWLPCCPFGGHLCKASDLEGEKERRKKQKRGERESAWKVSMVTFVSLFLIAYVILLLATLHPACRPAVYSVLVTLPRLCCLFVPTSSPLTLWFEAFTLSNKLIFKRSRHPHLTFIPSIQFQIFTSNFFHAIIFTLSLQNLRCLFTTGSTGCIRCNKATRHN